MIDWERVVREDGPAAWRTACRILGNQQDAQECVQDAFAEAIEFSRREVVQNCRALLLRVVTARSLDRLRRRYRRRAIELTPELPLADDSPAPPQQAQDAELLDRLRQALPGLPPQQSQAFVLHCVEGWSYQQIAEHLSVSVGAVGMLLLRARARLKELLSPAGSKRGGRGSRRAVFKNESAEDESDLCGESIGSRKVISAMTRLDDDNESLLNDAARAMADAPEVGDFPEQQILSAVQSATAGGAPAARHWVIRRIGAMKPVSRIAASLLIAGSVLAVSWASFHAGPVLAFATVAQQLHDAQTMMADLTIQQGSIAMNGRLLFSAPGHFRVDFPGTPPQIADMQTGKFVQIDDAHQSAVVMSIADKDAAAAVASIDWLQQLRNVNQTAGQSVGEAEINGIRAKQFNVTQEGQPFTIWADAKTGAPLRVQSEVIVDNMPVKVTLDHVSLGQAVDIALFSTAVPPGYAQTQASVSAAGPVEADLINFFKDYSVLTGVFPPSLNDFDKTLDPVSPLARPRPNSGSPAPISSNDYMQLMLQAGRVMMFLSQLPPSADWHYAGANVKPSTPDAATKPIFWYHRNNARDWRIIYADFHTAELPSTAIAGEEAGEPQGKH